MSATGAEGTPMSVPISAAHSLLDIMAFVDAGLYPFAQCTATCKELMPMSVDHGPLMLGGVAVVCCKCRTTYPFTLLRFLDQREAGALGWKFEMVGESPLN